MPQTGRHLPKLIAALALLAAVATPAASAERVQGTLNISFSGTSTLHDFSGTVVPTTVSMEQGANELWSADVAVPVAAMDTGDAKRDTNLRNMLDEAHYPHLRGRFHDVDPEAVRRDGRLPFALTIRTVEQPVQATISHWQQTDRQLNFDAEFSVSLHSFNLEAPRTLFFIRVGDAVRVTVHVTLERM